MMVSLVADVQRADTGSAARIGDRLARGAQVAVADIGAEAAGQQRDTPTAQQGQSQTVEAHARGQCAFDRGTRHTYHMDTVAQRRLRVGQINAVRFAARKPGGEDHVNQCQRLGKREHVGGAARGTNRLLKLYRHPHSETCQTTP